MLTFSHALMLTGKDGYVQDDTPIPLKPTLARGSATQRSKVPPIIPSSDKYQTPRDEDRDSAYAPSLEGTADLENQAEVGLVIWHTSDE